eukprot:jgi/Ulvmu1/10297/UM060_0099.1
MFRNGKMVIAGAKTEHNSWLAARKYHRILEMLGFKVMLSEFAVQNMVASCSIDFPIRLESMAAKYEIFCSYEPEVFPGLVFRMQMPKLVLLLFVTGKMVITGAKRTEHIHMAFENIYLVLQEFRKFYRSTTNSHIRNNIHCRSWNISQWRWSGPASYGATRSGRTSLRAQSHAPDLWVTRCDSPTNSSEHTSRFYSCDRINWCPFQQHQSLLPHRLRSILSRLQIIFPSSKLMWRQRTTINAILSLTVHATPGTLGTAQHTPKTCKLDTKSHGKNKYQQGFISHSTKHMISLASWPSKAQLGVLDKQFSKGNGSFCVVDAVKVRKCDRGYVGHRKTHTL